MPLGCPGGKLNERAAGSQCDSRLERAHIMARRISDDEGETAREQSLCQSEDHAGAARLYPGGRDHRAGPHHLSVRPARHDAGGAFAGAPGDFRAQATQCFENLKAGLASVGAGFEHVVKITNFFVDMAHLPVFFEVRDSFVNTKAPPASTAIQVGRLAREGALFEVEAVAVVPDKAARPRSGRAQAGEEAGAEETPLATRSRESRTIAAMPSFVYVLGCRTPDRI